MTDKPAPVPPRLSSQGLRMPANCREVFGGPAIAIIGAEHLRQRPPKDEAPAPTPTPSPAPPERK
jgi:hypothetical protein